MGVLGLILVLESVHVLQIYQQVRLITFLLKTALVDILQILMFMTD